MAQADICDSLRGGNQSSCNTADPFPMPESKSPKIVQWLHPFGNSQNISKVFSITQLLSCHCHIPYHRCPLQLLQLFLTPDLPSPTNLRPPIRQRSIRREWPPIPTLSFLRTLQLTQPISLAVTLSRIRTMHRLPPENHVPAILHHSSADVVVQRRLRYPRPKPVVIRKRTFSHLLPGHGELRAACYAHDRGKRLAGEELMKGSGVGDLGRLSGSGIFRHLLGHITEVKLGGAAQRPYTAQVGVSLRDDVGDLEILQQRESIWVHISLERVESQVTRRAYRREGGRCATDISRCA